MKRLCRSRFLILLSFVLGVSCPRVGAQGFGISVTASVNSITVSNSLTYTINVTNLDGDLPDAVVTNVLPASVQFQSATNYYSSTYANENNIVVFDLGSFPVDQVAILTVTAEPTTVGFITNTAIAASAYVTNTASASVVVQVTNSSVQADLNVTIIGPSQAVITNDWMTYGVTVTNAGPDAAPNVTLTNTLPDGASLKGISPANWTYATISSNLIFNLGTLTNDGSVTLQFTIQPTNAGALTLAASVDSANVVDLNPANNFAATNVAVIDYLPGTLVVITNSAQSINLQNGLTEQSILLSNVGTTNVPAARVVVTGLTNELFNSVGTNNGNPFVYYSAPLAAGQSVNLLLQFSPRGYFPLTNGQLQAFAVPLPNWTPPPATKTGTNIAAASIVKLPNGNMLIEFPSTLGRTYTIIYSDNVLFSNAMIAPPSVVAPANEMQWIDYGPPTTVSAPMNADTRFYRVLLNP